MKNIDPDFAKPARWLKPIDTNGTLYAIQMKEWIMTTIGGVRVNKYLQPLDRADMPILGVYVVGNDAGGLYAGTYSLTATSGSTFGFAINSGRLTAFEVLQNLGLKK